MTTSFEIVVILTIKIWIKKKRLNLQVFILRTLLYMYVLLTNFLFSVSKSSWMSDYRSTKTAAKSGTSTESDSKSRIRKSEILR